MLEDLKLPIRPKNPCDFSEGSVIRSVYSDKVYVITKHFSNGMCNLLQSASRCENWNACNNPHFIPADYVSLGVKSLL